MEAGRFSLLRKGWSGEIKPTQEQEPQRYFEITNVEEPLIAQGCIEPEMIEVLLGEKLKISGIDMKDGQPTFVRILASDIAEMLNENYQDFKLEAGDASEAMNDDRQNLRHGAAFLWRGYAAAFKSSTGEVYPHAGIVRIPISNGEIQEDEESPNP